MCGLERWRDVVGYEGLYQVSCLGRVRSIDRVVTSIRNGEPVPLKWKGKVLLANPTGTVGHLGVSLWKNGKKKTMTIHRLVTSAWIGPCPDGCQVCHGPNGKYDNSIDNLSYGTPSQNNLDKRRDGTDHGRSVIRSDGAIFINMAVAAEETGCRSTHICAVCKGKRKTTGGYGWSYYDD